jgi:hypothetical protein
MYRTQPKDPLANWWKYPVPALNNTHLGRVHSLDIAEAIKPTAESGFCDTEFDAEVGKNLDEERLELWGDPLLDRRVRCVGVSECFVEVLYLGYRTSDCVVPNRNVQTNGTDSISRFRSTRQVARAVRATASAGSTARSSCTIR